MPDSLTPNPENTLTLEDVFKDLGLNYPSSDEDVIKVRELNAKVLRIILGKAGYLIKLKDIPDGIITITNKKQIEIFQSDERDENQNKEISKFAKEIETLMMANNTPVLEEKPKEEKPTTAALFGTISAPAAPIVQGGGGLLGAPVGTIGPMAGSPANNKPEVPTDRVEPRVDLPQQPLGGTPIDPNDRKPMLPREAKAERKTSGAWSRIFGWVALPFLMAAAPIAYVWNKIKARRAEKVEAAIVNAQDAKARADMWIKRKNTFNGVITEVLISKSDVIVKIKTEDGKTPVHIKDAGKDLSLYGGIDKNAIRLMVVHAKEQWGGCDVDGVEAFKNLVWMECQRQGVATSFVPNVEDRKRMEAELAAERETRGNNSAPPPPAAQPDGVGVQATAQPGHFEARLAHLQEQAVEWAPGFGTGAGGDTSAAPAGGEETPFSRAIKAAAAAKKAAENNAAAPGAVNGFQGPRPPAA